MFLHSNPGLLYCHYRKTSSVFFPVNNHADNHQIPDQSLMQALFRLALLFISAKMWQLGCGFCDPLETSKAQGPEVIKPVFHRLARERSLQRGLPLCCWVHWGVLSSSQLHWIGWKGRERCRDGYLLGSAGQACLYNQSPFQSTNLVLTASSPPLLSGRRWWASVMELLRLWMEHALEWTVWQGALRTHQPGRIFFSCEELDNGVQLMWMVTSLAWVSRRDEGEVCLV